MSDGANGGQPNGDATTTTPAPWYNGASEDVVGYIQNKGWANPLAAIDSYRNLEKLVGAPPDKVLRLPNDDTPEAWAPIYEKLGRPADAAKYELQFPEGTDPSFVDWARGTFHKLNLTTKQAKEFAAELGAYAVNKIKSAEDESALKVQEAEAALKKEWGAAYEQNSAIVDQAANAFGMTAEQIAGLKQAMGLDGAMKFLHTIGSKIGEDKFESGGNRNAGFALTPAAAQSRINALKTDKEFSAKLLAGDVQAKSEWERLHKMAYPE